MTNLDSLQAICAELRDLAKDCHDVGNWPLGEVYDGFVTRLERLDAEMRKELHEERETHAQLQARCFDQGSQSVFDCVKELRARLAACETALRNIAAIEDEQYGGDWDEIERARKYANAALATPTAHPDVPGGTA